MTKIKVCFFLWTRNKEGECKRINWVLVLQLYQGVQVLGLASIIIIWITTYFYGIEQEEPTLSFHETIYAATSCPNKNNKESHLFGKLLPCFKVDVSSQTSKKTNNEPASFGHSVEM